MGCSNPRELRYLPHRSIGERFGDCLLASEHLSEVVVLRFLGAAAVFGLMGTL
jgi:hypothetical protein